MGKIQTLTDSFTFRPIGTPFLHEHVGGPLAGRKALCRRGVIQNYLERNSNKRIYPKQIWERLFKEDSSFMYRLKNRGMVGLLEHPEDGATKLDRSPSHVMTEVRFATDKEIQESKNKPIEEQLHEGDIVGTFEVIEGTRNGNELKALIDNNILIGVSSRGGGSLREDGDGFIVEDDYDCETWDVVKDPSVTRALPRSAESAPTSTPTPVEPPPIPAPVVPESTLPKPAPQVEATPQPAAPAAQPVQPAAAPINESTTNTMSKLNDLRALDLDVTRLMATPVKGMKPSQKAAIFDSITGLQIAVQTIMNEDQNLKPAAEKILKRLTEYEDDLDSAEAAPEPEPAPAPEPSPEPPVDDEPPMDDEGGAPDDEAATISAAAEKLEQLADQDPEAGELAQELHAIADTMAGDAGEEGGEEGGEELPPDFDSLPTESKKQIRMLAGKCKRLKCKNKRIESQLARITPATAKLLERYKALKNSLSTRTIGEDGQDGDYRKAARELAERYNRDMTEFGVLLMAEKRPDILEAHGDELREAKTWKEFTALAEKFVKEAPKAPVSESAPGSTPQPAPAPAADPAPAPAAAPVNEDVHPAVAMASRSRKRLNG